MEKMRERNLQNVTSVCASLFFIVVDLWVLDTCRIFRMNLVVSKLNRYF